jgi:hypothetical protein
MKTLTNECFSELPRWYESFGGSLLVSCPTSPGGGARSQSTGHVGPTEN